MIEYIKHDVFKKLLELDPKYYQHRWSYFQDVIYILKKTNIEFKNAVDLGTYLQSIIKNGHTIDIKNRGDTTYIFDANDISKWKQIEDKQYDLFIGMQVFEHLEKQNEIWKEVTRISNHAIISLPYMWNCYGDSHHGINEEVIYKWTKMTPKYSLISGGDEQSKAKRIICFYSF